MKIAFLTPETSPHAKTGGLADVAAALPPALAAAGIETMLFMPAYSGEQGLVPPGKPVDAFDVELCGRKIEARVEKVRISVRYSQYFIRQDLFFARKFIYGQAGVDYFDNLQRFLFFQKAVLQFLSRNNLNVDVFHLNDWQTALIPALIKLPSFRRFFGDSATLLTIHNLAYQGLFPIHDFNCLELPAGYLSADKMEFHGRLSFLKAGIVAADHLVAVSPTYAREILKPDNGCGLDGVLGQHAGKLSGILNGVDYSKWNPAGDSFIPVRYSSRSLQRKSENKAVFLGSRRIDLPSGTPMVAFIGRLERQKGVDLLLETWPLICREKVFLVVLGTGDRDLERRLDRLRIRYADQFLFLNLFSEETAHCLEAAADILLMPSLYEPCGLNQLYSMKYGTVPLVHKTGGLADSVREVDPEKLTGTGFTFKNMDPRDLLAAIRKALSLYADRKKWRKIQLNGMAEDFSWRRSAAEYIDLYQKIKRRK